ncbi:Glycerate kinase [Anaerovibrio sp. JC8]|uniref:glycerate kinase family protein n=1 Tax=Anaerovibrio sp. JC8 TaxID=1240085 RepID=UPI000A0B7610|nr:glycerate kinase [Anaerovibrio sp. JC8]ORT99313.1 Glycerate kinase [Anaerovibrio sp. JC8]
MNSVIAIDSFKGSLSSFEAGNIAAQELQKLFPDGRVSVFPLADGGEGTVDALVEGLGGSIVETKVTGPLGDKVSSRFGYLGDKSMAIIEMADAAGLPMVPKDRRNPLYTTTYGLGELIQQALDKGCREFIIGIGGSATNDAGLGMLTALGAKFFTDGGSPAGIMGKDLATIASMDLRGLDKRLFEANIMVACDVNNPLCGEKGCSFVYGPQKGADPDTVKAMDKAIEWFSQLAEQQCQIKGATLPGAGAAGGLGYAFHGFLKAHLKPGIQLVLDSLNIREALKDADLLITGEGRMDFQTSMGKAPCGVAEFAKSIKPSILAVAVCGGATKEAEAVNNAGIDAYFPIIHLPMTVEEAMEQETARTNLRQTIAQIGRLIRHKI